MIEAPEGFENSLAYKSKEIVIPLVITGITACSIVFIDGLLNNSKMAHSIAEQVSEVLSRHPEILEGEALQRVLHNIFEMNLYPNIPDFIDPSSLYNDLPPKELAAPSTVVATISTAVAGSVATAIGAIVLSVKKLANF